MYTIEWLEQKTLTELKQIGWNLNVLPAGDRRCRQYWIDALVGVNPPLLELLEASHGVEVDSVQEAIEVQRQEPIESKFGRIVYPKPAAELIAINEETRPDIDRTESADLHNQRPHTSELHGSNSGAKTQALGNQKGDRVLAMAGNHQADKRRFVPHQPDELTAASFNDEQPPNRGDGRGRLETELKVSQSAILFEGCANGFCDSPLTFSPKFLATYPPYFGDVHYKADCTGQLNLLEPDIEDEPPDPDDYSTEFEFWAAYDAYRDRTTDTSELPSSFSELPSSFSEFTEPIELSLSSMLEWAPCPEQWWNETSTVSSTLEGSPVSIELSSMLELSLSILSRKGCANESSDTSNFSIPVFGVAGDRTNDNSSDEPPTAGVGARIPKPKPPSFPPMVVTAGDRSCIKKFARSATILSGRAPPGGDVMN